MINSDTVEPCAKLSIALERVQTGYHFYEYFLRGIQCIIGMDKHIALKRMLTDVKQRMEPAQDDPWACALEVQVDPESGRAVSIQRHQWRQQVHQS